MTDELVDIINKYNQVVGQAYKSKIHEDGLMHRVSAILLQDKNGKYLIPTASNSKVEAGKLFHSAAGHVKSGDTSRVSAVRELFEEVGIRVDEKDAELLGSFWAEKEYPTRIEKERFEVYRVKYDLKMGKIVLNEEQVDEQWLNEEEIKELFLSNPEKFSFPLSLTCRNIFKFI